MSDIDKLNAVVAAREDRFAVIQLGDQQLRVRLPGWREAKDLLDVLELGVEGTYRWLQMVAVDENDNLFITDDDVKRWENETGDATTIFAINQQLRKAMRLDVEHIRGN